MAKVFISFNYAKDSVRANDVKSITSNLEVGQRHTPIVVTRNVIEDYRGRPRWERDDAIWDAIKAAMTGCRALVCIVGADTHDSPWINKEVALARDWGVGIVAVQGKGTTGAPPPALRNAGVPVLPWNAANIAAAIDKAISGSSVRR